jgi:hypothetical protein
MISEALKLVLESVTHDNKSVSIHPFENKVAKMCLLASQFYLLASLRNEF